MELSAYIRYEPETGFIYWLPRDLKKFNSRFAGKRAERLMSKTSGNKKYLMVKLLQKEYMAHRLIMEMLGHDLKGMEVDHINGNGLDNRLCNLRVVSKLENAKNRRRGKNNTSRVVGVTFIKAIGKWRAQIKENNKFNHLGYYSDWFDAVCARKSEERRREFHLNHGSDRPAYQWE